MSKLPVLILLSGGVCMGAVLLVLFLRGQHRPGLVALHVLLGLAALEPLMLVLRSTPGGSAATRLAMVAGCFLAWSLFSGFIRPMIAERSSRNGNAVLATHVGAGLTGFGIFLFWALRT
jgi:hypothetical protein